MEAWGERGEREHRAKRPGEPAQRHVDELEDKYLRLKEEHMALKKYSHDQDEKIKKMATKLVRLTSDLKKLRGGQPMATDPDVSVSFSAKHRGRDVEAEQMIEDLQAQLAELKKQNEDYARKLVQYRTHAAGAARRPGAYSDVAPRTDSGLERKRLVPGMRVERSGSRTRGNSATGNASRFSSLAGDGTDDADADADDANNAGGGGGGGGRGDHDDDDDDNYEQDMQKLVEFLRGKLMEAQTALAQLEAENAELSEAAAAANASTAKTGMGSGASRVQQQDYELRILRLQTEVQSLQTQLSMQTSSLEQSRIILEPLRTNQDKLIEENKSLNLALRNERSKAAKVDQLQQKVALLDGALAEAQVMLREEREAKAKFAEENKRLLGDAFFGERDKAQREQISALRAELEAERGSAHRTHDETRALLLRVDALVTENNNLKAEQRKDKIAALEIQGRSDELARQLATFESSGVDLVELQRALALVKARKDGREVDADLTFLLRESGWSATDEAQTALVHDLAKTKQLLDLQVQLNDDLKRAAGASERELQMVQASYEDQLRVYAQQIDAKNERIRTLEDQLADLLYHVPGKWLQRQIGDAASGGTPDAGNIKLAANENLFEVRIDRAELSGSALNAHAQFFCAFDVFEFETMCTPVMSSLQPCFGYTARYVVKTEAAFFAWLQSKVIVVELYQALGMVYSHVGTAFVSLDELCRDLTGKPLVGVANITGVSDPSVLGRLRYSLRMLHPMTESMELHRKRESVVELLDPSRLVLAASGRADQKRAALMRKNVLSVNLVSAHGLAGMRKLCVFYQLYGQPRQHTPVIEASDERAQLFEINDRQSFPLALSPELHEHLLGAELDFVLVDMADPNPASFFAVASVPLHALVSPQADAQHIVCSLNLLSPASNAPCGSLAVEIRWSERYVPPPAARSLQTAHVSARASGGQEVAVRADVTVATHDRDRQPASAVKPAASTAGAVAAVVGNKENVLPAQAAGDPRQTVTVMVGDLVLSEAGVVERVRGTLVLMYAFLSQWVELRSGSSSALAAGKRTVFSFNDRRTFAVPFGSEARAQFADELRDSVLHDPQSELGVIEFTLLDVLPDGSQTELGVAFVPFVSLWEAGEDLISAPIELVGSSSAEYKPLGELGVTVLAIECMRSVRQ